MDQPLDPLRLGVAPPPGEARRPAAAPRARSPGSGTASRRIARRGPEGHRAAHARRCPAPPRAAGRGSAHARSRCGSARRARRCATPSPAARASQSSTSSSITCVVEPPVDRAHEPVAQALLLRLWRPTSLGARPPQPGRDQLPGVDLVGIDVDESRREQVDVRPGALRSSSGKPVHRPHAAAGRGAPGGPSTACRGTARRSRRGAGRAVGDVALVVEHAQQAGMADGDVVALEVVVGEVTFQLCAYSVTYRAVGPSSAMPSGSSRSRAGRRTSRRAAPSRRHRGRRTPARASSLDAERRQAHRFAVEVGEAAGLGHRGELPVLAVRPAVVRAAQHLGAAARRRSGSAIARWRQTFESARSSPSSPRSTATGSPAIWSSRTGRAPPRRTLAGEDPGPLRRPRAAPARTPPARRRRVPAG